MMMVVVMVMMVMMMMVMVMMMIKLEAHKAPYLRQDSCCHLAPWRIKLT